MKKFLFSLMFNVVIASLLALGLKNPEGMAVNFVALWACFGCLVLIVASLLVVASFEDWLASYSDSSRAPKYPELFRALIGKNIPLWKRVWSMILVVSTVICLVCAGYIFIPLVYSLCVLTFHITRAAHRHRIEEAGLCPDSL
ncbi:lysA protein [Enterobacter hormaechei subsp. steigerwaltii]|uniref:DNZ54_00345 family protein n=1 Tax=Enterobacter hormaechei TaxID=158836 RepID=UPI000D773F6E|nr:DNZ54_00345 family protein [Enterobacter hormaechei]PXY63943.1 lysA protein [Enterobacter hormaechei subsp. steigerwaltii]